jgi:hypothetical protein
MHLGRGSKLAILVVLGLLQDGSRCSMLVRARVCPTMDLFSNEQGGWGGGEEALIIALARSDVICKSFGRSDFSHEGGFGW